MESYRQDFPYIGMTWYFLQRQSDWVKKISEETYEFLHIAYDPPTVPEPRRFPYVDKRTVNTYEVNVGGVNDGAHISTITTDIATNGIDVWGTVTDVTTTTTQVGTGDPGLAGSTKTQRIEHPLVLNDYSAANWCLSRPRQTRVTNTHSLNGGASVTRSVDNEWDASKCRMTQEVIEPGSGTLQVTTGLLYETNYGNLERSTVTPVGLPASARITQLSWGPNGQFLQSVTNPASHVTGFEWYADRGLLYRVTDPNTLQTTIEYDAFARESKQLRPDGTATHTDYLACDGDCTGLSNVEYKIQSTLKNNGAGVTIAQSFVVLDDFDRVRRATRFQLEGGKSDVLTEYAAAGWIQRMTQPHFTGGTQVWTDYTHDILGRVTQESRPIANDDVLSAHTVSHAFEGLVQKTTDAAGKLTTRTLSAWGDVLKVTDHDGKQVAYEYDAFGNLKKTTDPAGHQALMSYNVRGMKISSTDPDMGDWTYDYFPTGELKSQTDEKGWTLSFDPYATYYDLLGRPLKRSDAEGATNWTWGSSAAARNIGQLQSVNSPGWQEDYTFDSVGRPATATTTIDGVSHTFTNTYNTTTGFLETLQYPASFGTPFKLQYEYETAHKSGLLKRVLDFNAGTIFWEGMSTNAFSQYGDVKLGGTAADARTISTFDVVTGALNHTLTTDGGTAVQEFDYERDFVGNLAKRVDVRQSSLTETFGYDNLRRLTSATISGQPTQAFTYDAYGLGNLLSKTGTGNYSYTAIVSGCTYHPHAQPHAVREITGATSQSFCYDANGNMSKRNGATISWYSYNLPQTINQAGGTYATFSYDANRQRYKQVALAYDGGPVQRTTVYVSDVFEKVTESGASTLKHYIRANGDLIAVQLRTSSTTLNRFLYEDHLQSTEAFAGADGAPFGRFSLDAWGARRDRDWVGPISSADKLLAWQNTNRAFTSHEQLDNLKLVHMNGRVYDPGIGRFLSADPFVMDAFNLQALNRYSYVLNNPLSFTDPSGFTPQAPPGDDEDPFPPPDCGYDIFCGPPGGGGPRFPRHQPPIFTPPFGVGPGEWEAVESVMPAPRVVFSGGVLGGPQDAIGVVAGDTFNPLGVLAVMGSPWLAGGGGGGGDGTKTHEAKIRDFIIRGDFKGLKRFMETLDEAGEIISPQLRVAVDRAIYRSELVGSRVATEAAKNGFTKLVRDPPFNSHGQKVFTDGKNFLTRDVDTHSGGIWKMFDRFGNRIGTFDQYLNRIGP